MGAPAQTAADTSGIHLWLLLWKASRAVEARARASIQAEGLCISDFSVLEALLHKGPLPVNELGRKVLLTSGSITCAVDRLEQRGWVERRAAAQDRRARLVTLTTEGTRFIRGQFAQHARDMEVVFAGMHARERRELGSLLRKLGQAAEARETTKGELA